MRSNLYILFARSPIETNLKTRLASCCSLDQRQRLHYALVLDSLALLRQAAFDANADVQLWAASPWPMPEEDPTDFVLPGWISRDLVRVQPPGDLGRRMAEAFRSSFNAGYRRVVIIGSDSPMVPQSLLVKAFDRLNKHSLVLGPAEDGGFYLIGMAGQHFNEFMGPGNESGKPIDLIGWLLSDISWGTDQVLQQTVKRANLGAVSFSLLMTHFDIDECHDLYRLARELRSQPNLAPQTWAILERYGFADPELQRTRLPHCS